MGERNDERQDAPPHSAPRIDSRDGSRARSDPAIGWRRDRPFQIVFAALLVATSALFWFFEYLPLQDLPQHLALNSVVVHFGDAARQTSRYYEWDFSAWTYLGFRLFNWLFGLLATPMIAMRLYLTLYALLLPLAMLRLLAATGRNHWLSLFAFPLVLNTNLHWGFLSFCLGAALVCLALAQHERQLSATRRSLSVGQALFGLLLVVTHAQAFLAWSVCLGLFFVVDRRYRLSMALCDLSPASLLFVGWSAMKVGASGGVFHISQSSWLSVGQNWELFEHAIFLASNYEHGFFWERLWILCATLTILPLLAGNIRHWREPNLPWIASLRYELLTLVFVGLYFAMPYWIGVQFCVNPRMLLFAALTIVAAIKSPLDGRVGRYLARPALALVAVAYLVLNASIFFGFQQRVGDFERALATIPPGRRLLPMAFTRSPLFTRRIDFSHFGGYYVAAKGGLVPMLWEANGVRVKPRYRFWPDDWMGYRFSYDRFGRYFHYFLFRDAGRFGREHPLRSVSPGRVELLFRSPHWEVWRNRHPVEPPVPGSKR
ncbi:MAG: hypothetical protein KC609_19685 [Myxococcales bacterium]|nr:hypothetical protein [Myxococcales bacterium]